MRTSGKHFLVLVLLAVASVILLLGGMVAACGGDDGTTASTGAGGTTTAVTQASSTTMSEGTTTTTGASTTAALASTTTTAGSTTTVTATTSTSKASTTTAKPTTTTAKTTTTTAAPTTTTVKKAVALTVSGPSGTKELSMADLKAMSATSGYGGWKNELGNITGPMSWKGVSLQALIELVGGGGSVTVVASDGYAQTLSAGQVTGAVNTYDPATGEVISGVSVQAIVAYAKGGGALGSGEGPLRIAFVSSAQNQVTDSEMWVKYVVELRVD